MKRALVVSLLLAALPAAAQDEPIPSAVQYGYQALSWAQTLVKKGDDQKILFGARALGFVELSKWRLYGRADASASQDGGAAEGSVSFSNLSSFSDLELYGALAFEFRPGLQVIGVYGLAVPIEAGKPKLVTRYPKTLTLGLSKAINFGTGQGFAILTYGRHDAAGGEHFDKLVATVQIPIKAGIYVVADGVFNLGTRGASFSRSGIAYKF
jgi:hypothetical protein